MLSKTRGKATKRQKLNTRVNHITISSNKMHKERGNNESIKLYEFHR